MTVRHVLVHANGDDDASLTTALRVAHQAGTELSRNTVFHVVVQGALVRRLAATSAMSDDIGAATSDTVEILACRNSMARVGIREEELSESVGTVPYAGAYLAERQWDGWAYLRY